ncbi:MAG: hypothetical protein AB1744_15865, partial [Candidatus Zixiibacteriota bacterium]
MGFTANAEHFVVLPAVAGTLLLLGEPSRGRSVPLISAGLLFGLAIVMKQHAALFALVGSVYVLYRDKWQRRLPLERCLGNLLRFGSGVVFPLGVTCIVLLVSGSFGRFWFWTVTYASEYASAASLADWLPVLQTRVSAIVSASPLFVGLGVVGATALLWDRKARSLSVFLTLFLVSSIIATCIGFYFRAHYFILLLPAVAIFAGLAVGALARRLAAIRPLMLANGIPLVIVIVAGAHSAYVERDVFFEMTPNMVSRAACGPSPFIESLKIAEYIRERSSEQDTIAVLGSEPQIYFYSDRRSATGYIYMYPLMEYQEVALEVQEEMITEIERAEPRY